MERSFYSRSRDSSPLLPTSRGQARESHQLLELPPRPCSDSVSNSNHSTPPRRLSRSPNQSRSPSTPSRYAKSQYGPVPIPIPPPITSSVLFHTPKSSPSQSASGSQRGILSSGARSTHLSTPNPRSPLTILNRRERAIQTDLQDLLDAQSAGLIQGRLGGGSNVPDDRSSDAGSITPTSRSAVLADTTSDFRSGSVERRTSNGGVVPIRQPKTKKISLRGARRGILDAIYKLEDVKVEEIQAMDGDIQTLKNALSQVTGWEAQLAAFDAEVRGIADGADGREISELQTERSVIATEIRELEERLLNLRAKERHLGEKILELENRLEARESSFRNGRQELEGEVKRFLFRPPVQDVVLANVANVGTGLVRNDEEDEDMEAFLTLPPKRRTLEMARDWLASAITLLENRRASARTEATALTSGAEMWEDTVSLVTKFENEMKVQMSEGRFDLKAQLGKMGSVLKELERKALTAGKEGWNLLICAVGAELEAFREGEAILRDALGSTATNDGDTATSKEEELVPLEEEAPVSNTSTTAHDYEDSHEDDLKEVNESEQGNDRSKGKEPEGYRSESEDDGPDPAFFMSKDNDEDAS